MKGYQVGSLILDFQRASSGTVKWVFVKIDNAGNHNVNSSPVIGLTVGLRNSMTLSLLGIHSS